MKREEFEALVRRLEQEALRDPGQYRVKVGLLAGLGYGFILVLLAVAFALVAGTLTVLLTTGRTVGGSTIKLLVCGLVLAFTILRALWVTFDRPDGVRLSREDAPELFAVVEEMTRELGAPRFHHIYLNEEFNAAVYQRPRLGVFGWQENNLLVGLPLLQALSPEQFKAVLAHEIGHLRGGHGRFGGWVYRVQASWARLVAQLDRAGATGVMMRAFFKWYAPRFAAWSFPVRRLDEYEADRCAARLTSARTAADALCLLPAQTRFLNEGFWKDVRESVKTSPIPPEAPFTQLVRGFHGGTALQGGPDDARAALEEALREETGIADSHPALADRLQSLGEEARIPPPAEVTAAEHFFGPRLGRLADTLDRRWREQVAEAWREQHEAVRREQEELSRLDAKAAAGETLTLEEALQRASWVEEYRTADEALPLFHEVTVRTAEATDLQGRNLGAAALFHVGRLLLDRGDDAGIAYLDEAMKRTSDAVMPSMQILYAHHKKRGEDAAAREVYLRALRHADMEDAAAEERGNFSGRGVRYLPHGLPMEVVERIRSQVAENPDVAEAYLVRKELVLFPDRPLYVLGVTLTHAWRRLNADDDAQKVANALATSVTAFENVGEFYVITLAGSLKGHARPIMKVEGAKIYGDR